MADTTDDEVAEVFRQRDAIMAAHPEIAEILYLCDWHAWIQRRLQPVTLYEAIYHGGVLVGIRDVTPDDPEPQRDAAMKVVRAVAEAGVDDDSSGGTWLMFAGYDAETVREQARAFLASTDAEQGEA